jgi:hypothetical protein
VLQGSQAALVNSLILMKTGRSQRPDVDADDQMRFPCGVLFGAPTRHGTGEEKKKKALMETSFSADMVTTTHSRRIPLMAASPVITSLPAAHPAERAQPAQPDPARSASRATERPPYQPVIRTPFHAATTGVGTRTARRRITPQAGFALQALAHAIEYLADEYVHEAGSIPSIHSTDPRVEAIQMLMAANREVYYGCPVVPPLSQRLRRRLFGIQ